MQMGLKGGSKKYFTPSIPAISGDHPAEVHIIKEPTLKNDTWNVFSAGDIEMFLIQLSGHNGLLNNQLGGYYCNYLPSAVEDEVFKNLQTNYFKRYFSEAGRFSDYAQSILHGPFRMFQSEAVAASYTLTSKVRELTERQAMPRQYCGVSVLVFLEESLTQGNFDA